MNFYQAMQLDVSVCKGKIRNAANPSERHKLIAALIVKDILCVLFAVVFISILNFLFGDENSSAAVVIFCILLTVRFVDFGYCLKSSLINFFIVFVLLTFSPCIAQSVNPAWGFLINFLSIGFMPRAVIRRGGPVPVCLYVPIRESGWRTSARAPGIRNAAGMPAVRNHFLHQSQEERLRQNVLADRERLFPL